MEKPTVVHSTFAIERSFGVDVGRVFAAFADPAVKRGWYADGKSMDVEKFEMDFRVGGRDHARYRFRAGSPFPGTALIYDTSYHDIVEDRRIVIAYTVTLGEKRVSTSLVTFEFLPTKNGTDLILTEQGAFFEGADGPKMREDGWRVLLEKLADAMRAN
jgi:uncharacterized protein YndB with AHSA1/START domain